MTTTAPYQPVTASQEYLAQAAQQCRDGNFGYALDSYEEAKSLLGNSLIGPTDPAQRRALLKEAEFGLTVTLLYLRRTDEARESAAQALQSSYAHADGDVDDRRRTILGYLSTSRTPQEFSTAWKFLLTYDL